MRVFLLLLMCSIPGVSTAEEEKFASVFNCLHDETISLEQITTCTAMVDDLCMSLTSDITNKPPQTACYKEFVALIERKAEPVVEAGQAADAAWGDRLRAAALAKELAKAQIECDFQAEYLNRENTSADFRNMSREICRTLHWSAVYGAIVVEDRLP